MKYLACILFLLIVSCVPQTDPEVEAKRFLDSIRISDSLAQATKAAKEKSTADTAINADKEFVAACPELKDYLVMSHRIVDLMNSNADNEHLEKNFRRVSDSILLMETDIMAHKFIHMDSACKQKFLNRMTQNAKDISDGFIKKVKGE